MSKAEIGFYSNGRRRLYKDWTKCMNEQLTDYSVEKWNTFPQAVDLCMNTLAVISPSKFRNTDETKYAYLTNSESEIVLVTIGVGLDTNSEDKFRKEQPKTKFFGADPISERNEELYTKIGDFFPFAVGKETKKTMASVLLGGRYVNKPFFHLNIIVFLKYLIKQTNRGS
ncbi:hypothetical protein PRIPAC_76272 [Pristionchus pacificus]|nr:hypothetical protein PRIPAC_76272 [Pristionchus pacificus]